MNENQKNLKRNFIIIFYSLSVITLIGLILTSIWFQQYWNLGLMWGLACFLSGLLIGFIFGLPKIIQDNTSNHTNDNSKDHYKQIVNKSLEEISDWLTKIIVGLGLVNLKKIPEYIQSLSIWITCHWEANCNVYSNYMAAEIIVFVILGFFFGYLGTRLIVSGMFKEADNSNFDIPYKDIEAIGKQNDNVISPEDNLNNNPIEYEKMDSLYKSVQKIINTPLSQLTEIKDIILWAKVQLSRNDYQRAYTAYSILLDLIPTDAEVRFNYAFTLSRIEPQNTTKIIDALEMAKSLIKHDTSEITIMNIYLSLSYYNLYLQAPDGFMKTIRIVDEFKKKYSTFLSAGLIVNLAAAFGQQYLFYKEYDKADDLSLEQIKIRCLDACKEAISIDQNSIDSIKKMMLKNYPNKNPEDNDLEVFENDNDFRTILGLL